MIRATTPSDARAIGAKAFRDGETCDACPFVENSDLAMAFVDGWLTAKRESKGGKVGKRK